MSSVIADVRSQNIVVDRYTKAKLITDTGSNAAKPPAAQDMLTIQLHRDSSSVTTVAGNSPLAFRFWNGNARFIRKVPLSGHTKARLVVPLAVPSSIATAAIKIVYKSGAYSTTFANYLDFALSGTLSVSLYDTVGYLTRDSGWVDIPAALSGDYFIAFSDGGGDGVQDPSIYHATLFIK